MCIRDRLSPTGKGIDGKPQYVNTMDINLNYSEDDSPLAPVSYTHLAVYKRQIQAYLDKYTGSMVCSKQLYKEALNHAFDEPKQWERCV